MITCIDTEKDSTLLSAQLPADRKGDLATRKQLQQKTEQRVKLPADSLLPAEGSVPDLNCLRTARETLRAAIN